MATTKRGPKTLDGKTKAAKNSTKHGLRSENLSSTKQIVDQSNFLQKLIEHYKPVGPLEEMQLERIATCRIKLISLYDLEQAKMDLLIEKNRADLQKHIAELSYLSPLERGMLYELLKFKILMLPMDLNVDLLKKIVQEADQFTGDIFSDDDLKEYFPTLVTYLDESDPSSSELHIKMMAVTNQLQKIVDRGESYLVISRLIADKILMKSKKKEKELSPEEIAHAKAFDDFIEKSSERRRAEYGGQAKKKVEIEFPSQKKISEALNVFKTLLDAYQGALINEKTIQERIKMKELTVSLPIEEADLLMRYQTSWERRLSTLVGEFIQMQKMRVSSEINQDLLAKPKTKTKPRSLKAS